MTEEQRQVQLQKSRERIRRWRERVNADPALAAQKRAEHAARCRESRAKAKAAKGVTEPRKVGRPRRELTPEEIEAAAVKRRETLARWMAKPGVREKVKAAAAAWRAANPEKHRASKARYRQRHADQVREYNLHRRPKAQPARPFAGSVLAASAASPARDLLAQVTSLVPSWQHDRDDVIGEAVVLVLEGAAVHEAVRRAKADVMRAARPALQAVPVENCGWL